MSTTTYMYMYLASFPGLLPPPFAMRACNLMWDWKNGGKSTEEGEGLGTRLHVPTSTCTYMPRMTQHQFSVKSEHYNFLLKEHSYVQMYVHMYNCRSSDEVQCTYSTCIYMCICTMYMYIVYSTCIYTMYMNGESGFGVQTIA